MPLSIRHHPDGQARCSWCNQGEALAGFDFKKVARFSTDDIERLVLDAGIIRHRGKIVSAINNAQRVCDLIDVKGPGSLAQLVWSHEPPPKARPKKITRKFASTVAQTNESVALGKALEKLGCSLVGPTTMYAFLQSIGVVDVRRRRCRAQGRLFSGLSDYGPARALHTRYVCYEQ